LAVSQNGAETKLYQNVLGKPGLRVRLAGPPGNPDGVGATLRLVFGERMGAAREIHGVRATGHRTAWYRLWVARKLRPNLGPLARGKTTTSPIPTGAKEIAVDTDGNLTVNQKEP